MVTFLHGGSPFKVSQPDSFRIRLDRRSTFNYSRDILDYDGIRSLGVGRKASRAHPELATQLGIKPTDIYHVFEDSRGVTWFCTQNGIARRAGNVIEKVGPFEPKGHAAYRIYEDPRARIWFATEEGLLQFTASGLEPVAPGMPVRRMFGDRDGNLWVSTNGDGLYRFKDAVARTYTKLDGMPSNIAMSVMSAHDGSIWAGFNCGGIAHLDGRGFHIFNEKDGLLNSCVWSLAEDRDHDLWIGTWGAGVFRFHDGKFTQYSQAQGLRGSKVECVVAARDGSIWVTGPGGVSRIRDGRIRNYTVDDGLISSGYYSVHEDQAGGIWVKSHTGTDRMVGSRFEPFSIPGAASAQLIGEGLAGAVYFAAVAPDDIPEIYRFADNQLTRVASGLDATQMMETKQGDLWAFSQKFTTFRFPAGALEHAYRQGDILDYETYGPSDGLSTVQPSTSYPISALAPDGKVWIATTHGLAVLDVPHISRTDSKPAIHIQGITVGRNQKEPASELILPSGTNHLELSFDAIELTSPEKIRLQYRMDGVDSEWLDASPPGHAVYSTLPPGSIRQAAAS